MIKFSIITCTYNAEHYLQRTLESVLRQTYPEVEHIIQDGCSKDETVQMAKEYKEISDQESSAHDVVFVSEHDGGLYDAMNRAMQRATGDYLVFLNAGDKLPGSDTLELLAATIGKEQPLPGVLYGDTNIVDDEGRFLHKRKLAPPERLTWRSFRKGMLVCHQSFYVLTSIAKETPYDLRYKLSADVDWCIRVMKKSQESGRKLLNARMVLCDYLEGGMSIKNHRASLHERFTVMRRHYGLFTTLLMHFYFIFRNLNKKERKT
ncbi:MAG: glycosyltransferase family 2 protein [Prevotella sp.]|jgi:glycosyltransferase involved in cell wall biosynthesis